MQGYAWLYLIAYPIDYIIYAYNYIYGFFLFADGVKAIQFPRDTPLGGSISSSPCRVRAVSDIRQGPGSQERTKLDRR